MTNTVSIIHRPVTCKVSADGDRYPLRARAAILLCATVASWAIVIATGTALAHVL